MVSCHADVRKATHWKLKLIMAPYYVGLIKCKKDKSILTQVDIEINYFHDFIGNNFSLQIRDNNLKNRTR